MQRTPNSEEAWRPNAMNVDDEVAQRVMGRTPGNFSPSADHADSWRVVQRLNELGCMVVITANTDGSATVEVGCVSLAIVDGSEVEHWSPKAEVTDPDVRVAICYAALASV
jgi:hypothetical protein